jgi:hypothetical protein
MTSAKTDLNQFHDYLAEIIAQGRQSLLPEEALDEWREGHPLADEDDPFADDLDDVAAVREAIADRIAGDKGQSLDEVLEEIASVHQLVNPLRKS